MLASRWTILHPTTFGLIFGATGIVRLLGAIAANRLAGKIEVSRLALPTVSVTLLGVGTALS